jgi:hypothetical protein
VKSEKKITVGSNLSAPSGSDSVGFLTLKVPNIGTEKPRGIQENWYRECCQVFIQQQMRIDATHNISVFSLFTFQIKETKLI